MNRNQKILIFIFVVIALVTAYISCTDGGDFDVYLDAAKKLTNRQNIYVPPFIKGGLQYFYSVFFVLILSPFANHIFVTEFFWLLLSFFLLFRIKIIISHYFDNRKFTEKQNQIWFLISILLSFQFIVYDIALIQVTIFLLWSILESLYLIKTEKLVLAGLILALAINIKIMPIVILPYLFYRGHFKSLFTCIISFMTLLYLPSILIGWDYNSFLLSEWWKVINPANKEHMFETRIGTHSIVAWLPVFLTPTEGDMPFQRNLFNINYSTVMTIVNVARLVLLSLSILFLKSLPFKKESNPIKLFWEGSYFIMLIPLLMPHQQKYNFLLVLPMIIYILYFFLSTYGFERSVGYRMIFISFILCMIFYSPLYGADIIGWFLFRLTQHYRFLTFPTIFLIPIALYCNPMTFQ